MCDRHLSVFTALHSMQGDLSQSEMSVRLSVCPSVKHVNCDKMKEICVDILIPHERLFILVFCQEK